MGASLKIEKKTLLKDVRRLVIIIIASFVISLNLKTFVRTGDLLPGGLSGITILIQQLFLKFFQMELPYSAINLSLNAIPAIISYKYIGKKFTIFSGVCIFLSSIFTDMLPSFQITYDILLISIFGGIIAGVSVSACLLAGATAGGTDFIAIFFAQKHGIDTFNYILCGNAIVLIIAGCIFGWDRALYSIIYQFTTTQIIHTCYKRYQRNTLLIIT
ncbi:MAG: YitT family protein, partial [Anaerotignaceae bacterium]